MKHSVVTCLGAVAMAAVGVGLGSGSVLAASPQVEQAVKSIQAVANDAGKLKLFCELNETGVTIFLVEQNAFHALKIAHRAYVMVSGTITMTGTGPELLARPEVRAAYLEGGREVPA